jgi:hypothetical protein
MESSVFCCGNMGIHLMQHGKKNTNTTSQKPNVELEDVVDNINGWRLATMDEMQHLVCWMTDAPPLQSSRSTVPHTDSREGPSKCHPHMRAHGKGS